MVIHKIKDIYRGTSAVRKMVHVEPHVTVYCLK